MDSLKRLPKKKAQTNLLKSLPHQARSNIHPFRHSTNSTSMTYIEIAKQAATQAGAFLKKNFGKAMDVDEAKHHDIKLALDRESQDLITGIILAAYPDHAIYGEEGIAGDQSSEYQWICLLYTSPSPRDQRGSRMPSSA